MAAKERLSEMDSDFQYDLGIIGGGPAGYTAGIHAALKGMRTVLFEENKIGGVCLNKGCIPTKSILRSSEIYKQTLNCAKYGVSCQNAGFDYSEILKRKNNTVEKLQKGVALALKNAGTQVVCAHAELINAHEIKAENNIYTCKKIICASGSSPKIIKGLEFDHKFLLSSDDILSLEKLPQSALIIGSGAIGTEWSRILSNFGVETTVVELAPHLLPLADIEVSKRLERIFKANSIKFYTGTTVENISGKTVKLSNGEVLTPEIILVAVGRTPNPVSKIDGVTYIGDVSGEIQLAHYAIKQALEEIDAIPLRRDLTPSVVYGTPEIAWAGKREQDLEGQEYKKLFVLVSSLGKAWCDGETDGFIKLLVQKNKIAGAHIVSSEASSLLQQVIIAMQNDISVDKLKEICFAHPTYSEGIFDALFK